MTDADISTMVRGSSNTLSDAVKDTLEQSIRGLSKKLEQTRNNMTTEQSLSGANRVPKANTTNDAEMFTSISEMINGATKDFAGFGTMLDNLYAKNKKYFTIIKDYEIMPILIPQINRVLTFLVNECLSPDVQNEQTFVIKYTGTDNANAIQEDIDSIKKEMKLDNLLREVYWNRYKLGREYYIVQDYNKTFEHMIEALKQKQLGESTVSMSANQYFESIYRSLRGVINEVSGVADISVINNGPKTMMGNIPSRDSSALSINEGQLNLDLKNLNIVIERSPIAQMMETAYGQLISESYAKYSTKSILNGDNSVLNEDVVLDNTKMQELVQAMKKKDLHRCSIVRLDPAKTFKLKIGGKVIGYFYVTDINEGTANMVNFEQSLKDQLLKTRATNLAAATQSAEEVIAKELATKIINTFDPNLGINRIEDIDLMHDFIRNNDIYKGNKRITFYYADEIFDCSRADDSILTNAVFFTKLYSTLILNNIVTKVLRGRGRQIHTVRIGASPNVQRYINNAMAALSMPDHNLGTLHGSFEQIMNPFNGASDIVIPTEEDDTKYINTDYIPGQDVDMNDEFLKTLLNNIVCSFNLDSAVLDATNGNLQFARTLTMESLQISNSVKNEQQDLFDSWNALCLEVLKIMGSDDTKSAINNEQVEIRFFQPKSLIIQNTIDDINNAKSLAEAIADIIPEFNEEDAEIRRSKFIYMFIKDRSNYDFSEVDDILKEIKITTIDDALVSDIRKIVREYMDNEEHRQYSEVQAENNGEEEESEMGMSEEGEEGEEEELTPEEEDLMNSPDEEEEEEETTETEEGEGEGEGEEF